MSKFLNTKDFFLCTGGIMPAQMQTHQQVVSKKDGETKFLTKIDTHTTSIADFSCKKMMILMAIIAVVICALTIATGGAALIAAAAIGGAVGAAAGALICGCQGAAARMWFDYKENVKLGPLQVPAVTDKAHMKCSIFNEEIRLAPHIKNWWQAALVGISNFAGEMFKCVMVGAAAAGVAVLASEGILAFLGNAVMNWGASFGLGGLLLRGGMGLNQMVQDEYVNGQGASADSFASGFWSMETGTAHSAYNVATGQGKPEDYAGLLAWGAPIGGRREEAPLEVDGMSNAWEGKPQSGKTGFLESPRMSRAEMQAFKNDMQQKGIDVIIDKKGVLPEGKQAGFDYQKGKIYLRKGATDYEAFHESKHAEQWLELGKENYLKQNEWQREQYVYDQIIKNKDRFSEKELDHANKYINKKRGEFGIDPIGMDYMAEQGKVRDGDLYEDAAKGAKNTSYSDFVDSVPEFANDPAMAQKAYDLFQQGKWGELETLFKENNLNSGWPPNRGFADYTTTTIPKDKVIDRYGGWYDENGKFNDKGTFASPDGVPFEDRALPADTKNKPYNKYRVLKPIENVREGPAIPWFEQKGLGTQYELPMSVQKLIKEGYLEPIK
jgi:hypothetical protein